MENIDEALIETIDRTKIIAVGVSQYDCLKDIPGPMNDLELINKIFIKTPSLSIYSDDRILIIENPTLNELNKEILDYSLSISSPGDILIFYFSGHGYVSAIGDFGLCCKDTRTGFGETGVLPLSVLNFSGIIKNLSVLDIYSCFIIDACFSSASSKVGEININLQMEYEASKLLGNNYAFFSSSNQSSFSLGDQTGGYFTNAIHETIFEGLPDEQNNPYICLADLPPFVDKKLKSINAPLSRINIGQSFPNIPIAKNIRYNPKIRTERFVKSYKELLEYAWNSGKPRCFSLREIRKDLPSGYGNHNKFEYIWGLLENDVSPNGEKCRKLSTKGIDFMKGNIKIHREMRKTIDGSGNENWIPTMDSEEISFDEI